MKRWVVISLFISLVVLFIFFWIHRQRTSKLQPGANANQLTLLELILLAFFISYFAGTIRDNLRDQDLAKA